MNGLDNEFQSKVVWLDDGKKIMISYAGFLAFLVLKVCTLHLPVRLTFLALFIAGNKTKRIK
jgi:hypothetical protein